MPPNCILEGLFQKAHACDFSEKGQNKILGKCTKFENILKKDSLMRATIACMKQLEYALSYIFYYILSYVLEYALSYIGYFFPFNKDLRLKMLLNLTNKFVINFFMG